MEDEETLFDRDILLRETTDRGKEGGWCTRRHIKTYGLALAFFALGLCIALPGPTLADLQITTHTSISQIMYVFTGRSAGYLVGSIVGGVVFEKANQLLLLCSALWITSLATAVAPWCKQLILLIVMISAQGLTMGFLDTGGNVICLKIWGRDSSAFIHSLHSAFAVGAFLAPIITTPFLSVHRSAENITSATPVQTIPIVNNTLVATSVTANVSVTIIPEVIPAAKVSSYFEFSYLVVSLMLMISAMMFCVLWCRYDNMRVGASKQRDTGVGAGTRSEYIVNKERRWLRIQILVGLFIFYFFYVGMEVAYGNLISAFTIEKFKYSKPKASLVASVFWGVFAVGRIGAIFLAHCISPAALLCVDLSIATTSLGVLSFWERLMGEGPWFETVVWVGSGALGFGMSSIFPAGLSWAERYMTVTGGAASVFVVGSAFGEMVVPAVCGYLMDHWSPEYLLYSIMLGAAFSLILFSLLALSARRFGERYDKEGGEEGGGLILSPSEDRVPLVLGDDAEDEESTMLERPNRIENGFSAGNPHGNSRMGNTWHKMENNTIMEEIEIESDEERDNKGLLDGSTSQNHVEDGMGEARGKNTPGPLTLGTGKTREDSGGKNISANSSGKGVPGKKRVTIDPRPHNLEHSRLSTASNLVPKNLTSRLKTYDKRD